MLVIFVLNAKFYKGLVQLGDFWFCMWVPPGRGVNWWWALISLGDRGFLKWRQEGSEMYG